jgi:imidazolonepropionase
MEGIEFGNGGKADLIVRNAGQLLTLAGPDVPRRGTDMCELGIIEDGAVAVKGGRIVFAGRTRDCNWESETEIRASGRVVMPGFVDPHTHLVFAGTREDEFELRLKGVGYKEIASRGGGIKSTVQKTRQALKAELMELAEPRLDDILRWGTTTVEIKSGYGLERATEMKMLEVIRDLGKKHLADLVPTYLGAHDFPEEFSSDREGYVNEVIKVIPEVVARHLARFCDVFCEEGFFSVEQSRRILKAGLDHGLPAKIHADELASSGGAELAAELKALSADHLTFASDRGLQAMGEAGTIPVLLPGTSFFLKAPSAPARKMIDMGLPVAIGSDFNPGSCPISHMPVVIGLACIQYGLTPAEAITASTINGACALGLESEIATLETGKKADLLVLRVENFGQIPYFFGANPVEAVVKGGEIVL